MFSRVGFLDMLSTYSKQNCILRILPAEDTDIERVVTVHCINPSDCLTEVQTEYFLPP